MTIHNDGYQARKSGKLRTDNPHEPGTWAYEKWDEGWHQADQELESDPDFGPGR